MPSFTSKLLEPEGAAAVSAEERDMIKVRDNNK